MTVRSLLTQGYDTLFYAEIETPLLDAVVLLAHALGTTKERVLSSLPDPVAEVAEARYRGLLDARCAGTPVSYIRGLKEFFDLEFLVDSRVLVPRPDTETIVEKALSIARANPGGIRRVHDACTGSGCIGISLKHEMPLLDVSISDISADALAVAEINGRRILGQGLPAFASDLLDSVPGTFDLVVSNPPYLRDAEVDEMAAVGWPEPQIALRGGVDGLAPAERLIRASPARLARGGWLLIEAAPDQLLRLHALMDGAGFTTIDIEKDLAGRDRVIAGRLDREAVHG
jgi:release factor glutamine methyltransferase